MIEKSCRKCQIMNFIIIFSCTDGNAGTIDTSDDWSQSSKWGSTLGQLSATVENHWLSVLPSNIRGRLPVYESKYSYSWNDIQVIINYIK